MRKNLIEAFRRQPVSDGELKRRLDAVQAALKKDDIECLVLQTQNSIFDSNIRYFLDVQTGGYASTLMIPADGGMVYLSHGPSIGSIPVPAWARNVEKAIINHYCPPFPFTDYCAAEIIEEEIRSRGYKKAGIASLQLMAYGFGAHMVATLADVEFVDFSVPLNEIRALKSAGEWELIDLSVIAHEKLMDMAPALIVPGYSDFEIRAALEHQAIIMGCEFCGNVSVTSSTPGELSEMSRESMGRRVVQPGDMVNILLEVSGPGGMYGELARTFCLAEPTSDLLESSENATEIQFAIAAAAKPGVTGAELNRVHDECAAKFGVGPNLRYVGHGQGYDMMESPAISKDETMELKEDMLLAIHPQSPKGTEKATCCDNFRVTANGAVILSKTPRRIYRI